MLHDNLFLVDYRKRAVELLPTKRRTLVHRAFAKLLVYPFVLILQELRRQRAENIERLTHSSIVGVAQKLLNDKFDPINRRIVIADGQRKNPMYIYTPQEKRPKYLPFWIYTPETIARETADFEVHVPSAVGLSKEEINRLEFLTRYYADKDKTFIIKVI